MLGISWKEHRTNISILEEIGLERELMGILARMKLQYFGHVTRGSAGNLALTVLEGSIDGLRVIVTVLTVFKCTCFILCILP